jgi:hypothetical protein
MTKARERGANEITDAANRESQRTGGDVCDILAQWLRDAKLARDKVRIKKIERAQKYLGCRNIRRQRGR